MADPDIQKLITLENRWQPVVNVGRAKKSSSNKKGR